MEFSIDTNSLHRAIRVLSVVVRMNAIDFTGRILIEAKEDKVKLMADNGVTSIVFDADKVEVEKTGSVALAFNKIRAFALSFKPWDGTSGAKSFKFKANDKATTLTVNNIYENGKSSNGKLRTTNYNPATIAKPPEFGAPDLIMNSAILRAATSKVLYAINPQADTASAALKGMNVSFDKDYIYFVGCDGIVLSEYRVNNVTDKKEGSFNLQYNFFMGLKRLLNGNTQLMWEIKGKRVTIKFDDIVFTGRTIVGHEYPDYKPALEQFSDHLSLNKEFLMTTLAPFMDVLAPEDHYRLTIEIKDRVVRFYNDHANIEAEQDIQGGLDLSVDVNGKLLMQSIDAIQDDYIIIKFSDQEGSLIFDSSTFNDQKALIRPLTKR